jgi:hypothetical protein
MKTEWGAITHAGSDARTFLSSMLESEQAIVREKCRILVAVNGKDATFMFWTV